MKFATTNTGGIKTCIRYYANGSPDNNTSAAGLYIDKFGCPSLGAGTLGTKRKQKVVTTIIIVIVFDRVVGKRQTKNEHLLVPEGTVGVEHRILGDDGGSGLRVLRVRADHGGGQQQRRYDQCDLRTRRRVKTKCDHDHAVGGFFRLRPKEIEFSILPAL